MWRRIDLKACAGGDEDFSVGRGDGDEGGWGGGGVGCAHSLSLEGLERKTLCFNLE